MNQIEKSAVCLCLFLLSTFFLSPNTLWCEPLEEEPTAKRAAIFLKHVMIECNGVYTLLGSKPITAFSLVPVLDEADERELYNIQTNQFRKHIPFEKYRPTREGFSIYWHAWASELDNHVGPAFSFVKDAKFKEGIFINHNLAEYTFTKYADEFEKVTGEKLAPKEAVQTIGTDAPYWRRIQKNHFLLGVLFGFGEKNARLFHLESKKRERLPLRHPSSPNNIGIGKPARELVIEDLDIPHYVIYQLIDETVKDYHWQRKKCLELYKDQDFIELTLSLLKGDLPEREAKTISPEARELIKRACGRNSY